METSHISNSGECTEFHHTILPTIQHATMWLERQLRRKSTRDPAYNPSTIINKYYHSIFWNNIQDINYINIINIILFPTCIPKWLKLRTLTKRERFLSYSLSLMCSYPVITFNDNHTHGMTLPQRRQLFTANSHVAKMLCFIRFFVLTNATKTHSAVTDTTHYAEIKLN